MVKAGIQDPFVVKHWGIKLATNAAITVLRVDQVSLVVFSHLFSVLVYILQYVTCLPSLNPNFLFSEDTSKL